MPTSTPPAAAGAAPPAESTAAALHFEGFDILPGERRLLVQGEAVKIGARAFDLLMVLVVARDRVVSKDELLERVWRGLVVEENNLPVHVSQLRKLCGARVVATVPGRGYQFTAASADASRSQRNAELADAAGVQSQNFGNLPALLPPLIGRQAELAELLRLLQAQRWVTVTGAGGMGKTRLAEAAGKAMAAQLPTWLVELAAVSDPRFVPNAVAQVLGATIVDAERPLQALVEALRGQPALLILDNCEHLTTAVAGLGEHLLRELPLLRVLVTSQELLRSADEVIYKLGPLALPDAGSNLATARQAGSMCLLQARVQALSRKFEISADNFADAVAICHQLDGLPLAIELAAGRVPLLGLGGVRARLGVLFRLLTGDARVRLRRHQTLRAALDWSYQLLAPAEQVLLRRLGVFSGSFSVLGVRQIADDLDADEWDVLDTLGSLIDKSMVQLKGQDRPRYLLLETTRAYALEQLAACGETNDALARHARATRQVCLQATRRRDTEAIWDEIANVRAAFAWAMHNHEAGLAVALANESSVVLALGGLVGEVLARLVEVEPMVSDQLPQPLVAQYWQWLGRFGNDGRLPAQRCVQALQTAEDLFRLLRNDRHVHACLRMRAEALVDQGELDAASQALACARRLESDNHPRADRMRRLRIEGKVLEGQGRFELAVQRLEQALELARLGDVHRYVLTLTQDIGHTLLNAGDAVQAEQRFRAVLDDPRPDLSVALAVAYARMGLATAMLIQGRLGPARATALEAVPLLRSCGILLAHAECLAWLLAASGQHAGARVLLCMADSFRADSQTARGPLQARAYRAARELLGGHADEAPPAGERSGSEHDIAQLLATALVGPAHSPP